MPTSGHTHSTKFKISVFYLTNFISEYRYITNMDRKVNLAIGGLIVFILSKYSYSILLNQIPVTGIAESPSLALITPFIFLFIISLSIAIINAYIGEVYVITLGICLSVAVGTGLAIISGYIRYSIMLYPLILLPLTALVLGLATGMSLHRVRLGNA